jgi:serine/threonine protein kinase/tetratricopeptide (TPR) repeat protein
MGEVYKAQDTRLDREVAVKVISEKLAEDPRALARFEREAKAVAALSHPNILAIHDFGKEGALTYAVMELLEGETLRERLARGPLPISAVQERALQIADALAAAHEKGIVHRDLKPGNIFLTKAGRVKILDFGLARLIPQGPLAEEHPSEVPTRDVSTRSGMVLGTMGYMAPEQARGLPCDHRADLFAFGAVLYEMISGRRAFDGGTASDMLVAILTKDPPPLPPVTPPGFDRVVRQCLEKRPEDRFSTAHDVALSLETVLTSGEQPPHAPQASGWLGRHWLAAASGAVLILLLAALLALNVGSFRSKWFGTKAPGTPAIRSIAVLPLANLSGDPAQEFFSDGMTEELITHLSKISALKVISRTSAMHYKDTKKPLKEIAQELKVAGIVEGSVLRSGNRVRITAQLIDASTDTHLWAESYERDIKDIFALQGEVARTIAGAVNVALTPQEQARLAEARPVNPEAYEAYLKGMYNWMKLTPQGIDASRGYFERALEKDPSCAPAYQGLAWFWLVRQQIGITAPSEAGPKAKAAALQAIALDDASAEAHEALAAVKWSDWDWAGSEQEWRRTFELNPNSSNAHAYYAHFLAITGRAKEAVPHSQRAIELDPSNALFHAMYAVVLVYDRRYDDAMASADNALTLQPDMGVANNVRQWVYIIKGMKKEQLAAQRQRIAKDPERVAALEKGLARGGYEGAQRAVADLLAARYEEARGVPNAGALRVYLPCGIAFRYFDARDYDRAVDWLEKAYEVRDPNLPYQIASPVYDPLRSNPRFQALTRRMGLPVREGI